MGVLFNIANVQSRIVIFVCVVNILSKTTKHCCVKKSQIGLLDAIGKFCVQCCSKDGINNDRDDIEQIEMGNIGTDRTNGAMVGLSTYVLDSSVSFKLNPNTCH